MADFFSLKRRAEELREQANAELDPVRRAQMRALASDLEQQARDKMKTRA